MFLCLGFRCWLNRWLVVDLWLYLVLCSCGCFGLGFILRNLTVKTATIGGELSWGDARTLGVKNVASLTSVLIPSRDE